MRASLPASSRFSASEWASWSCSRSISASLSLRAFQKASLSLCASRGASVRVSRTRPLLAGAGAETAAGASSPKSRLWPHREQMTSSSPSALTTV